MIDFWTRAARSEDLDAIAALSDAAFGGPDEGRIIRQLQADGDSLASLVAETALSGRDRAGGKPPRHAADAGRGW